MEKLPKLNLKLLNDIVQTISKESRRFRMDRWSRKAKVTESPCGMQGCLGGWAVILSAGRTKVARMRAVLRMEKIASYGDGGPESSPIFAKARSLLGLTNDEARSLFLTNTFDSGAVGVKTAKAKIALLKRDRAAFVQKYPYR